MGRTRKRRSGVVNPLRSRNRWAVRGRAVAYFVMSFFYVVVGFVCHSVYELGRITCARVAWCIQRWQVRSEKVSPPVMSRLTAQPTQVIDEATGEADGDIVEGLCHLGCRRQEAEQAVAAARLQYGRAVTDEDLFKAALQHLKKLSAK